MNYRKNSNFDFDDDDDYVDINNYDNDTYSPSECGDDYPENIFENDRQYESDDSDDKYIKENRNKMWDPNNSCLLDSFVFQILIISNIFMTIYSSNHKEYFSEPNLIYFVFSLATVALPFINNHMRGFTTDANKFFYMYGFYMVLQWWDMILLSI